MAMPRTALEDIRVLDWGRYQAGPRIGLVLARLGAEVIKVEAPGEDERRRQGPTVRGQSAYWVQYTDFSVSSPRQPRMRRHCSGLMKVFETT
jgi:crotonobetainyl-CoA:carnitine CoA-transferase CaiB-like acyl-CoA transferase